MQQQNILETTKSTGISSNNENYTNMFNNLSSSAVSLADAPTPPACSLITASGSDDGANQMEMAFHNASTSHMANTSNSTQSKNNF